MSDFETRLAEARERLGKPVEVGDSIVVPLELEHRQFGFDAAVAFFIPRLKAIDDLVVNVAKPQLAQLRLAAAGAAELLVAQEETIDRAEAKIARLEAEARRLHDLRYERDAEILRLKVALADPRKVSDAQRERFYERLERNVHRSLATMIGNDLLAIIESPADAYETVSRNDTCYGFDAAAAIAREVVAEKDAEIARLKDRVRRLLLEVRYQGEEGGAFAQALESALADSRKVSDAQRKLDALRDAHSARREDSVEWCNSCDRMWPCETVRIIESPTDAEATT